jgi:hypothetical protein
MGDNIEGLHLVTGDAFDRLLLDAFGYFHELINHYHKDMYGDGHCDESKTHTELPCLKESIDAAMTAMLVTCAHHEVGHLAISGALANSPAGLKFIKEMRGFLDRQTKLVALAHTSEEVSH